MSCHDHVPYDFQLTARESAILAGALFPPELKNVFSDPSQVGTDTIAYTKAYRRFRSERLALRESNLLHLARGRARELIETLEQLEATTSRLKK